MYYNKIWKEEEGSSIVSVFAGLTNIFFLLKPCLNATVKLAASQMPVTTDMYGTSCY